MHSGHRLGRSLSKLLALVSLSRGSLHTAQVKRAPLEFNTILALKLVFRSR